MHIIETINKEWSKALNRLSNTLQQENTIEYEQVKNKQAMQDDFFSNPMYSEKNTEHSAKR